MTGHPRSDSWDRMPVTKIVVNTTFGRTQNTFCSSALFLLICPYLINQDMEQKHSLVIAISEELAELPIQIIKGKQVHNELVLKVTGLRDVPVPDADIEKKYAMVWQKDLYVKIMLDDILWIQADHGYSDLILRNGRKMTVSFNPTFVGKWLPTFRFMRIHKSYIVNLKHVESLTGNNLMIGNTKLPIGREYKEKLLERFLFIGIRRKTK